MLFRKGLNIQIKIFDIRCTDGTVWAPVDKHGPYINLILVSPSFKAGTDSFTSLITLILITETKALKSVRRGEYGRSTEIKAKLPNL